MPSLRSLRWQTPGSPCQTAVTLLHADRVDSAAGCTSWTCEVAMTERSPLSLDSDLFMH